MYYSHSKSKLWACLGKFANIFLNSHINWKKLFVHKWELEWTIKNCDLLRKMLFVNFKTRVKIFERDRSTRQTIVYNVNNNNSNTFGFVLLINNSCKIVKHLIIIRIFCYTIKIDNLWIKFFFQFQFSFTSATLYESSRTVRTWYKVSCTKRGENDLVQNESYRVHMVQSYLY